ncbi:MAG: hypothetical protein Q9162_001069 [Coniocarpon cinnabarinum]
MRCDLQRPSCNNCISTSRECEGYERFPIFITKTLDGYQKRKPLEEVKPRRPSSTREQSMSATASSREHTPLKIASSESASPEIPHLDISVISRTPSESPATGASRTIKSAPQIQVENADEMQLTQNFLDLSMPTDRVARLRSQWLFEIGRETSNELFSCAFLALASARVGRMENNRMLISGGRCHYSRALSLLQKVYEPSTGRGFPNGWMTHVEGLEKLVLSSDPRQLHAVLDEPIMQGWRIASMYKALVSRKRSLVEGLKWVWPDRHDAFQILSFDLESIGFQVAAINETASFSGLPRDSVEEAEMLALQISRLAKADASLLSWYGELAGKGFGLDKWCLQPMISLDCKRLRSFQFPDLNVAHLICTFWALRTVVSSSIEQILSKRPLSIQKLSAEQNYLPHRFNSLQRKKLSLDMLRAMPYFLRPEMGAVGPTLAFFGFSIAMNDLAHVPNIIDDNPWIYDIHTYLVGSVGFHYQYSGHGTCAPFLD